MSGPAENVKLGGWRPDLPDSRDLNFESLLPDLLSSMPLGVVASDEYMISSTTPISDQGKLSSCVANAVCDAFELLRGDGAQLSRLFVYWNARRSHGDECKDEGTFVRAAFSSLGKLGVCPEEVWPYDVGNVAMRPSVLAYSSGYDHKIAGFYRIMKDGAFLDNLEVAIRANHPVVFGTLIGKEFTEYDGSADVIWHAPARPIGGHAMVIDGVRYIGERRDWRLRNSWSVGWGQGGCAWASSDWLTDPTSQDFWVATLTGSD